jgi:hypothetical protein
MAWTGTFYVFRCFLVAKATFISVMSIRPSVRTAATRRIFVKFDIGVFYVICGENSNLVKIGEKNIGHFIFRPTHILLSPATLHRHKNAVLE